MKVKSVTANNRRRAFEIVTTPGRKYGFPYAKLEVRPTARNRIVRAYPDPEIGREGFTYVLASGDQGTVHLDSVLEYNENPEYLHELLLYKLTVEAQRRIDASALSKREIIRRLRTSPAQLYRLLDPSNTRKSMERLIALLRVLDCDVEVVVKDRAAA